MENYTTRLLVLVSQERDELLDARLQIIMIVRHSVLVKRFTALLRCISRQVGGAVSTNNIGNKLLLLLNSRAHLRRDEVPFFTTSLRIVLGTYEYHALAANDSSSE